MSGSDSLGASCAHAIAAKDTEGLRAVMHPEIDFRGMTPGRTWEAGDRDDAAAIVLGRWFEPGDRIESVEEVETAAFADRERVGYRFEITNANGRFLVEQQAYIEERDGQIGWIRLVCSGFRPVSE